MTILALTKCLQILLKDSTLSIISITKKISSVGCIDTAENGKRHLFFGHPILMSSSVGVTLVRLEFQRFSVLKDFNDRSVPIRSEAIARPPVKMPPEGNPEGFPVG